MLLAYASQLVAPGGKVFGIEHIPQLVQCAAANLGKKPEVKQLVEGGVIVNAVSGMGLGERRFKI